MAEGKPQHSFEEIRFKGETNYSKTSGLPRRPTQVRCDQIYLEEVIIEVIVLEPNSDVHVKTEVKTTLKVKRKDEVLLYHIGLL